LDLYFSFSRTDIFAHPLSSLFIAHPDVPYTSRIPTFPRFTYGPTFTPGFFFWEVHRQLAGPTLLSLDCTPCLQRDLFFLPDFSTLFGSFVPGTFPGLLLIVFLLCCFPSSQSPRCFPTSPPPSTTCFLPSSLVRCCPSQIPTDFHLLTPRAEAGSVSLLFYARVFLLTPPPFDFSMTFFFGSLLSFSFSKTPFGTPLAFPPPPPPPPPEWRPLPPLII